MAPNEHLLASLCHEEDTLNQAKAILRLAQTKTTAGSGFELGAFTTGLPAVCAYIASQRTNSRDVSRKSAQVASCLKPTDFDKVLLLVEAAIVNPRRQAAGLSYDRLAEQCGVASSAISHLLPLLEEAEGIVVREQKRKAGVEVRCGVFYWGCKAAKVTVPSLQTFAQENSIPVSNFRALQVRLDTVCSQVRERIVLSRSRASTSLPQTPTKPRLSPTKRSPTKSALRALPSKDSPQKREVTVISPQRQEEEEEEEEMGPSYAPETPVKKRKAPPTSDLLTLRTPTKRGDLFVAAREHRLAADTPLSTRVVTDPSGGDAGDGMTENEDGDGEERHSHFPYRRFRPVFWEHRQWETLDPMIASFGVRTPRFGQSVS